MPVSDYLPEPSSLQDLLSAEPIALFLDFDGTLVDIAPTPDAILPIPELAAKLRDLSERLDHRLALVSGRSLQDIEKHIGKLPVAGAGSHGSELRALDGTKIGQPPAEFPPAMKAEMRAFAAKWSIDYETKPHGGALHFRSKPELTDVVGSFVRELAAIRGWKAQEGKCVFELVKGDKDKGSAVRAFMEVQPFEGSMPVFVGDDLTDEAGFAACKSFGSEGILVGDRDETSAGYRLPDVASVHHWLGL